MSDLNRGVDIHLGGMVFVRPEGDVTITDCGVSYINWTEEDFFELCGIIETNDNIKKAFEVLKATIQKELLEVGKARFAEGKSGNKKKRN